MYQINDFIIYGTHGVCRITDIGTISMSMADKNRQYYTLVPYYQKETVIYAPVDNNKTVMRPVITKEEAKRLIEDIPNIETVWIGNERERENQYKTAIRTCECRELIKIIKTLYERKQLRLQDGKKPTVVDERYFHMAENQLYGELSFALDIEREKMAAYIADHMTDHMAEKVD